jgi:hypothetical protein
MAQQHWSRELANLGPAPNLQNPLFAADPPWRTCDMPATTAAALDAAPDVTSDGAEAA